MTHQNFFPQVHLICTLIKHKIDFTKIDLTEKVDKREYHLFSIKAEI